MDESIDAPILAQLAGQYEKMLMMVLWKYLPDGAVITWRDLERALVEQGGADPIVLFSHGHKDSIEFKAIRASEGKRRVEHDQLTNTGRA
jgi:hypothetical protein